MRTISVVQLEDVVRDIIASKESRDKALDQPFAGVTSDEVLVEIKRRLGDGWILKEEPPFKLSPQYDIPAIANARYFRGMDIDGQKMKGMSGQLLWMLWAMTILGLAIFTLNFRWIPASVYYVAGLALSIAIVYFYSKGQKTMKNKLRRAIEGRDRVEADR